MKKYKSLFLLFVLIGLSVSTLAQREVISLNKQWEFSGASIWEDKVEKTVDLPHTWNTEDAAQGYEYYRGEGKYSKKYFIDQSLSGKRLFLKFEGVQTVANVWVNGNNLPEHRGGYSAFTLEITDVVRFGEENLIEVKVDNSKTEDVLPLGGDFNIYGGIYRPFQLIITEKVCISPLHFGSPGVLLIQNTTDDYSNVRVEAKISNRLESETEIELLAELIDDKGETVDVNSTVGTISVSDTNKITIPLEVISPHLWDGLKDPYLYTVKIAIKHNGRIVDELIQPLGLRYYSVDSLNGFFLNGVHLKVKGVSRHNDWAGVASALTEKHHRIDMELIKEMGANGIRLAHYQHSEYFYDLCDSVGMIVWAEIPFVGSDQSGYTNTKAFRKNATQQLQELLRQNYNHPSILFWGIYNEIGMKEDPVLAGIIDTLNSLAKDIDPIRETVAASFITRSGDALHKIPDNIAWNQYYGWYYNKPEKLGNFLDRIHEEQDGYKIGISEYGAGGSAYQHEEKIRRPFPFFHPWHPEEFQTTVHEGNWKAIAERDFVWGSFIWNMFDFGSHFRREGDAIGMNDKGMVTYDRKIKKDAFYFYKANWNEEPEIHITNKRFAIRQKENIKVKVYSNLENVELFVNSEPIGTTTGEYATYLWEDVQLQKGNNHVKVVGQKNGKTYTDSAVWMYEKKPLISFAITFMRWLIKPFLVLLVVLTSWLVFLLFKKRAKGWKKALIIISLIIVILLLVAFIVGQIMGGKVGLNLFEYSLI